MQIVEEKKSSVTNTLVSAHIVGGHEMAAGEIARRLKAVDARLGSDCSQNHAMSQNYREK